MFSGKRILFITQNSGFRGGLELYLYLTATLLRAQNAQVWLCYQQKTRNHELFVQAFDHAFKGPEIPQEHFDLAVVHGVFSIGFLHDFLVRFKNNATLFMHAHDYYCPRGCKLFPIIQKPCKRHYSPWFCGFCGMIKKQSPLPYSLEHALQENLLLFRDRLELLKKFPKIVVLSPYMRDELLYQGFSPNNMHVIPPAIPVPIDAPVRSPRSIPEILFLGRFEREKGVQELLQVLTELKQPFHAKIVGNGSLKHEMMQLAKQLGITQDIQFCPMEEPIDDYFADADLMLAPSIWEEPFNMSIVMAAGWSLPTIAFNTGDVPNMVQHNETGFCVAPGNIQEMAQYTDQMLANFEMRQSMGNNARQHIIDSYGESRLLRGFLRLLD